MAGPIPLVLGPVLTGVASCQTPVWVVHGRACSARGPARTGLKLRSHLQWGSGGHRQQYRPSVEIRGPFAGKGAGRRKTGSYQRHWFLLVKCYIQRHVVPAHPLRVLLRVTAYLAHNVGAFESPSTSCTIVCSCSFESPHILYTCSLESHLDYYYCSMPTP